MRLAMKIFLLKIIILTLIACEKDPVTTEEPLEIDSFIEDQAAFGFEVNQIVTAGKDISKMTLNSQFLEEEGLGEDDLASIVSLIMLGKTMMQNSMIEFEKNKNQIKILADSVTIYEDDKDRGIRYSITYNSDTGLLRYYEVKYSNFLSWQKKNYDSTEIVFDLNFTPWDGSDDKLLSVVNSQAFVSDFYIQRIVSEIAITAYEGTEPAGIMLRRDSYYNPSNFLLHLTQSVVLNVDKSGTLREDFDFKDGTSAYKSVTFYADQTGEFIKQLRDGTIVNGIFDCAEDDLEGSWTETIDFPEGRYIDKILRSAEILIIDPFTAYTISLSETIIFSLGLEESSSIEIGVEESEEVKTTNIQVNRANGAHGTFAITETKEVANLVGEWFTRDHYFIEIEAQYYADGSGHLLYRVYEPPYVEGNEPIIVVEYFFSPDGSGEGTLVHNGITYLIKFFGGEQGEISHGTKKGTFNLFR